MTHISVAMCTCNGARFVDEQLASIAGQERVPDELVVCDDASDDETPQRIERFARQAPFEVRLVRNERRLGVAGNFTKAMELCRGEIIALADQDDVWMPRKLARLADALDAAPEAGFAFSDAEMIDDEGRRLPYSLWQAVRIPPVWLRKMRDGRGLDVLLKRNIVTGATMAFRASYRDLVLPVGGGWIHDGWIALLVSCFALSVPVDERLIGYRQHATQQLGERKKGLYQQWLVGRSQGLAYFEKAVQDFGDAHQRLVQCADRLPDRRAIDQVAAKVEHVRAKAHMRQPGRWRLPLVVGELVRGRYGKYGLGWKSLAQDLLL